MSKQNIMKYLKEQFGITTERELNAALAKVTPIHIGIMTSKKEVGKPFSNSYALRKGRLKYPASYIKQYPKFR